MLVEDSFDELMTSRTPSDKTDGLTLARSVIELDIETVAHGLHSPEQDEKTRQYSSWIRMKNKHAQVCRTKNYRCNVRRERFACRYVSIPDVTNNHSSPNFSQSEDYKFVISKAAGRNGGLVLPGETWLC